MFYLLLCIFIFLASFVVNICLFCLVHLKKMFLYAIF
jgi:hypothetical protein